MAPGRRGRVREGGLTVSDAVRFGVFAAYPPPKGKVLLDIVEAINPKHAVRLVMDRQPAVLPGLHHFEVYRMGAMEVLEPPLPGPEREAPR